MRIELRAPLLVAVFLIAILAVPWTSAASDDAPRITKEQLKERLGDPTVTVIDTRIVSDWRKSDRKIAGAVRGDPHDVSSWSKGYGKDRTLVVYCS